MPVPAAQCAAARVPPGAADPAEPDAIMIDLLEWLVPDGYGDGGGPHQSKIYSGADRWLGGRR